jgi:outer membrane receptor protein involved in Fe transport
MKLDNWIVTAGLRHDKAVSSAEGRPDEETSATTKRLGVMYAHPSGWSPYVSYSESFTPQAAIKGKLFTPLRGEQWELGLKYEPAGHALAYSAALYDLREKNQIASPLPNVYTQVGATRTKGLELEVKGSITPTWTWWRTTTTPSWTSSLKAAQTPGQRLGQVPLFRRRRQRLFSRRGRALDGRLQGPARRRQRPGNPCGRAAGCDVRL